MRILGMFIDHLQSYKSNIHEYHIIPVFQKGKKIIFKLSHREKKLPYFVCFILTSILFYVGCGYVSTSSYLEHIDTIRIEPIQILDADIAYDNVSQRPYDEVIHEKITNRFNRKWNDGSDSKFTIRIVDYHIKEQGYGPSGNVEMLRMSLQVEYEFIDNVRDNLIAKTDNHLQIHDFYIVENRGEPPETVDQAKTLIIDELIEDLYNQLAEQW